MRRLIALLMAAVLALGLATVCASAQILPYGNRQERYGQPQTEEYKEALNLFEKGMYDRSMLLFKDIARTTGNTDAYGYYVLNATYLQVPGYEKLIDCRTGWEKQTGPCSAARPRLFFGMFILHFNSAYTKIKMPCYMQGNLFCVQFWHVWNRCLSN